MADARVYATADSATLWFILACTAGILAPGLVSAAATATPSLEQIKISDNRASAGTLSGGTLTVRIEARTGEWHPDGDADPGIVVKAFSTDGGPLQIPGPVIRVKQGTEVRAFVRNALDGKPLVVHGLYERKADASAAPDPVSIAPGEVREVRFMAGKPGTYYYWAASTAAVLLAQRSGRDSQLTGALVVDPLGANVQDRVLLIGGWSNSVVVDQQPVFVRRIVINGKSWPHTERLTYRVNDPVHMRVINAGAVVHPMHLHGFYFNVDSRGDEVAGTVFANGSSAHMVNTERLASGRTFSLTWIPTRTGNWLFHCHDNLHLLRGRSVDGHIVVPAADHHVVNHALEMMAGPVMGITVVSDEVEPAPKDSVERRRLRLIARVDTGGTETEPAFGYSLEDGGKTTPLAPPYLPGPTIVLERGKAVSITVDNQLPEPTAVHWHGIELESYYDGVAGFAGSAGHIAPPIPPGGTFEARFTPPRSGTFIYHTHIDEVRQQQAGLSGALLVVDSLSTYDPDHDFPLLVTVPRRSEDAAAVVLLNGSAAPPAREMRTGERYRLRFINVHTSRPSMRMSVMRDRELLSWRALAKDGMDLPADQATSGPSTVQMGNGETYDFEFVPPAPGAIRIQVANGAGDLLVSMPVHVR